jgi:hypothetical protein
MSGKDTLERLRQAGGMRGVWCAKEMPKDKAEGILQLTDEGYMRLTVERHAVEAEWTKVVDASVAKLRRLVVGQLDDGTPSTLEDLTFISYSYNSAAEKLWIVYSVQRACFGAEVDDLSRLGVRNLWIEIPALMDWAHVSGCSASRQGSTFSITATDRQEIPLAQGKNMTASIGVSTGSSESAIFSKVPRVTETSGIVIAFSEQVPLRTVRKWVPLILDFFSLATLSAISVSSFSCQSDSVQWMMSVGDGEKPVLAPITIWYPGSRQNIPYDGMVDQQMFFTYADVRECNRLDVLPNLLARSDEFGTLLSLLVPEAGSFYSYSKRRFLDAVQALESVDRIAGYNAVLPANEFEVLKCDMLNSVQAPTRRWIEDTFHLQYANEPNLRSRIKNVVQEHGQLLQATPDSQKGFINSVVRTRNYLVHLDTEAREQAVLDDRLVDLTDKVEALARISFLRSIGFSEDDLRRLFSHHERPYIRHLTDIFRKSNDVIKDNALAEEDDTSSN